MQLQVLGIAQDGGHPQAGCLAPCCAPAWRRPSLAHKAACLGLLHPTAGRFLLDATPDLGAQAHALGATLQGVILTHAHMGHYTGLLHLGREAWAAPAIPCYAMPRMRAFLLAHEPWRQLIEDRHIQLKALERGLQLAPDLRVTPWEVPHRGPWSETVALRIQGPTRQALYLPDVDRWEEVHPGLDEVLSEVALAFVDGTFFDTTELPDRDTRAIPHPTVRHTMDRFQALPASLRARLHFIHLNHSNPLLDPHSEATAEVRSRGYRIAREGDTHPL